MNNVKLSNNINQNRLIHGTNTYQHITLTYDGIEWVYYLNGVKTSVEINSLSFDFFGNLIFGIIGNANFSYSTTFDEVRFWNKALSHDEIFANWNKSLLGDEDGLQVYYNFNDQYKYNLDNTNLIDLSPNKKMLYFKI